MWGHLVSPTVESRLEARPRRALNAKLRHLGSSKPDREDPVKPGTRRGGRSATQRQAGSRKPRDGAAAARVGRDGGEPELQQALGLARYTVSA